MNKKGFTLIEVMATVIILGIISTMAVGAYYNHLKKAREESFAMTEKTLINNVQDAYADCLAGASNSFCRSHQNFGYQDETVYLKDLIDAGYSERIRNPYNTDEYCDVNLSFVKVKSDGNFVNNPEITYEVCLTCGDKQSSTCAN